MKKSKSYISHGLLFYYREIIVGSSGMRNAVSNQE